jgi:hypothetical protein
LVGYITSKEKEKNMKVVQVQASRDYDGIQWTGLFSSVEKALDWVRTVDADQWYGIDDVDVAWVGVDTPTYQRVLDFSVRYDGVTDTRVFTQWDKDTKSVKEFSV